MPETIHWGDHCFPYASFITSIICDKKVKFIVNADISIVEYHQDDNLVLWGDNAIAEYFIASGNGELQHSDVLENSEVRQWSDLSTFLLVDCGFALDILEGALKSRTYLVGHEISLCDITLWACIMSHNIEISDEHVNVKRWYGLIGSHKTVKQCIGRLTSELRLAQKQKSDPKPVMVVAGDKQNSKKGVDLGGMPPLPNAVMGKVITRFPPEASGYLHIGHVKAVTLNATYAQMYKGKLLLRFDDTNPAKEKGEFENAIIEDLKLLGVVPDMKSYTSDFFPVIIEYAEKLIKEGKAYMDNTDQETMRNERLNRVNSKNRDMASDQSMELFHKLLKGDADVQEYCLRAKINMQSENGTMRDPVIFRYNPLPHMRSGDKYKAYPTYDLACPIVDSIEGVTHAMRTTEYKDRDEQYVWLQKALGLREVYIIEFGRLNFQQTLMSKRKLQLLVDRGEVEGWDDPRFPTVKGIIKRGVQISALKTFILAQGFSKNIVEMEWNKFWTLNKKEIDPIAPRYMAVLQSAAIELRVSNLPKDIAPITCDLHPKNTTLGKKTIECSSTIYLEEVDAKDIKVDEEITLMRWGNFKVTSIHKNGEKIDFLEGEFVPNGDFKKTEKKLTWVSKTNNTCLITLVEFDYLITKKKLDEDEDFENCLTSKIHPTRYEAKAISDPNIKAVKENDVIQLERKGYFRVQANTGSDIILYMIPDGHDTSMSTIM